MRILFTTYGYAGKEEVRHLEGYDKVYVTNVNRIHYLLRLHRDEDPYLESVVEVDPESLLESWKEGLRLTFDDSTVVKMKSLVAEINHLEMERVRIQDEIDLFRTENEALKKMLRDNLVCPYGSVLPGMPMSMCPSGFPGCACADDCNVFVMRPDGDPLSS